MPVFFNITKVQHIDQAADLHNLLQFYSADFLDQSTEVLIGVDFLDYYLV